MTVVRRRASDGIWWKRWVASRWLCVTMVTLGGGFYLAVVFGDPGVFSTIAVVALGAGQMHNTFSRPRPLHPRIVSDENGTNADEGPVDCGASTYVRPADIVTDESGDFESERDEP